jgi:hypothetical protein
MYYFIVIIKGKTPFSCVFHTYDDISFIYTGDFQTDFYKYVLEQKVMSIDSTLYTKEISPEDHAKFIKLFDGTVLGDMEKYYKIIAFIGNYVNINGDGEQEEEQEEEEDYEDENEDEDEEEEDEVDF